MRLLLSLIFCLALFPSAEGQKRVVQNISKSVTATETASHLAFLSADEMRGRNTGSRELDIAANYIATQFKILGLKPSAVNSYFQDVFLSKVFPPNSASFTIDTAEFILKDDILVLAGFNTTVEKEVVYIGYGTADDFEKTDVTGKIVVALAGTPQTKNAIGALRNDSPIKRELASAHKAAALIEIMMLPGVPWQSLVQFLSPTRINLNKETSAPIPHLLLRNSNHQAIKLLQEGKSAMGKLQLLMPPTESIRSKNVISLLEGTDSKLKNEWIAVSAHYDHVGVKKNNSGDSIFNGARDNAIGTVAMLAAAKYFKQHPPKRSLVFIALTAEEVGLLGSAWYADKPVIPLEKTIFNMNCDGAGYNDTTMVTVIDFNRTTADEQLKKACQAFGLTLKGDPAPEQNLYERSDNFNFAKKGIPAVDIAPGIKAFDQDLFKYYHQPADEFSSLDMHYLEKFFRSFVYATSLLANDEERPRWKAGDKFETVGEQLYKD